jgi:basic amino acid/polyamine antiporter, APA family
MARDGLLPGGLAKVDPRSGAPLRMTLATAVLVAILAGLAPLSEIASLANAGTLTAFAAVSLCLLVLRRTEPDRPRLFRTSLAWVVAPAAILGCVYLFWNLQAKTQLFFAAWNLAGLACYFAWRAARRKTAVA